MQLVSPSLLGLAVLTVVALSAVEATYHCSQPSSVTNGGHNGSRHWSFSVGSVIKYWCNDGYTLQGSSQRICSYSRWSGSYYWSGTAPSCVADYQPSDSDEDDHEEDNESSESSDSSSKGIYGDSGESRESSSSGGVHEESSESSKSSSSGGVLCSSLSSINNGYVWYHGRYPSAIAKYYCKSGYTLEGKVYRKCLSSGYWSGSEPKCKKLGCEKLISPKYGVVIYSSTEVGSYAKYFCKEGYYLVGVKFRKCEETGWTEEAPICKPILCDPLPKLEYGRIYFSHGNRFNSVATHRCYRGYSFKQGHGDIKRVCQEDGSWSGSPPLCIPSDNKCPYLNHPENGYVKVTDGRGVGAEVWYVCNAGYYLEGSESRRCGSDLNWSGDAPKCVAHAGCDSPDRPDDGWVQYSHTAVGAKAWYYCKRGYVRVGAEFRTCESSGEWEPELPICKRLSW